MADVFRLAEGMHRNAAFHLLQVALSLGRQLPVRIWPVLPAVRQCHHPEQERADIT